MSGGITLCWKMDVQLKVIFHSGHHIDIVINTTNGKK